MMHQHDRDLVMALAEGTLDPEAVKAARAEIASCAECTAELVLQTEALAALRKAPRATLTELESARLRRDLKRELEIVTPDVVEPRRRRFTPALVLGGVAALLLAVVLVGPALQNLGGSSDDAISLGSFDEATEEAAPTAPAATAAPATTFATATTSAAAATTAAPAPTLASPTADSAAAPAPPDDGAGGARDFEASGRVVVVDGPEDLERLKSAFVDLEGDADLTVESLSSLLGTVETPEEQYVLCGEVGIDTVEGATLYVPLGIGEFEEQKALFLGFLVDPVADSVVVAYQSITCDELGRAP